MRIFCNLHKIHSLNFTPRWGTVGAGTSTRASANPPKKYKKTANFVRNQQLNMVARTGLKPVASGL